MSINKSSFKPVENKDYLNCFAPDGKIVTVNDLNDTKVRISNLKTRIERVKRLKDTFNELKTNIDHIVTDRITQ